MISRPSFTALAALLALAGCGEASTSAEPAKSAEQDRARTRELMARYTGDGTEQWSVKRVIVDGDRITVDTGLSPEGEGRFNLMGVCTTAHDAIDWVNTIEVNGADGEPHARWAEGDVVCTID